jgi:osmotically-inducible protein OsmY
MAMNVKQAIDRAGGLLRSSARRTGRLGRYTANFVTGRARATVTPSRPKPGMDDQTLKNKVETEIFREADSPKGSVNVSVVDGVVELRGEVKRPEIKKALEDGARSVPEVKDVRNLLHLPKTPAPGRADSPGRQSRSA